MRVVLLCVLFITAVRTQDFTGSGNSLTTHLVSGGFAHDGSTIIYNLTITNNGPDNATSVHFISSPPATELSYQPNSVVLDVATQTDAVDADNTVVSSGTITTSYDSPVASGDVVQFSYQAVVVTGVSALGYVDNSITLKYLAFNAIDYTNMNFSVRLFLLGEGCSGLDNNGYCTACYNASASVVTNTNRCRCMTGYFDSDTNTGNLDQVCVLCGHGGTSYGCDPGQAPTGTVCTGTNSDTQTCAAIGEGCSALDMNGHCTACQNVSTEVVVASANSCQCVTHYYDADPGTGQNQLQCTLCPAIDGCQTPTQASCSSSTTSTCTTCLTGRYHVSGTPDTCPLCTVVAHCTVMETCSNATNSRCGTCAPGYVVHNDGIQDSCLLVSSSAAVGSSSVAGSSSAAAFSSSVIAVSSSAANNAAANDTDTGNDDSSSSGISQSTQATIATAIICGLVVLCWLRAERKRKEEQKILNAKIAELDAKKANTPLLANRQQQQPQQPQQPQAQQAISSGDGGQITIVTDRSGDDGGSAGTVAGGGARDVELVTNSARRVSGALGPSAGKDKDVAASNSPTWFTDGGATSREPQAPLHKFEIGQVQHGSQDSFTQTHDSTASTPQGKNIPPAARLSIPNSSVIAMSVPTGGGGRSDSDDSGGRPRTPSTGGGVHARTPSTGGAHARTPSTGAPSTGGGAHARTPSAGGGDGGHVRAPSTGGDGRTRAPSTGHARTPSGNPDPKPHHYTLE